MDGFPNTAHSMTSWHGMHHPRKGSPRTLKEMLFKVKNILKKKKKGGRKKKQNKTKKPSPPPPPTKTLWAHFEPNKATYSNEKEKNQTEIK